MRVLHVGSGFRPWRRGGLVAYIEDLMRAQVRRGDEVAYFFSGRQYPGRRRPRLRRWLRDEIPMYEVIDSPLHDHGRQPALELAEPRIERMLAEVMDAERPDVVHVQEIAGLPSSVLDVIARRGVPAVVTLQDYFFVCPTFRLLDADGRTCLQRDIGAKCVATATTDPRGPEPMFHATLWYDGTRLPVLRGLDPARRDPWLHRIGNRVGRRVAPTSGPQGGAAEYQHRRDENVRRLSRADAVIAMSDRVAELHVDLGVDPARVRTVHLTLEHIERLTPREPVPGAAVTFASLAALESESKGGRLLLDAVELLQRGPAAGRFRVVVLGHVAPHLRAAAEEVQGVEVGTTFAPSELDAMLDGVDVGLMPSLWEEAYGYAGVEFLAKGIPVIANAIGGMPDYVRDGETGWLNRSCSAAELADIMRSVIERPEQVATLNASLRASRSRIVKPMARHADEMDAIYAEVVAARARR